MKLSRILGRFGLSVNYFFHVKLKKVCVPLNLFILNIIYHVINCSIHLLNLTIAFEGLSIGILPQFHYNKPMCSTCALVHYNNPGNPIIFFAANIIVIISVA